MNWTANLQPFVGDCAFNIYPPIGTTDEPDGTGHHDLLQKSRCIALSDTGGYGEGDCPAALPAFAVARHNAIYNRNGTLDGVKICDPDTTVAPWPEDAQIDAWTRELLGF